MSEGLWGSALMFFNVLFAALISFNFYEPLAQLIIDQVGAGHGRQLRRLAEHDAALRHAAPAVPPGDRDSLAPSMVRFPTPLYHLGRVDLRDRRRGRSIGGHAAAGLPGLAGPEEDARGDGLQAQAVLQGAVRPRLPRLLPVHDRLHLRPERRSASATRPASSPASRSCSTPSRSGCSSTSRPGRTGPSRSSRIRPRPAPPPPTGARAGEGGSAGRTAGAAGAPGGRRGPGNRRRHGGRPAAGPAPTTP